MKRVYTYYSIWSIVGLILSTGTIILYGLQSIQLANAETNNTTCTNLCIGQVVASSDDGNIPPNAIDNDFGTRWSGYGVGSWIRADLGLQKTVCYMDVAWYKGNDRSNNFSIAISNDGSTYTTVYSSKSSGTTLSSERYDFADTQARYVKITVNGNTQNNWASITEIDMFGSDSSVTAPPPSNLDKFGIKMIYPTKPGGEEWYLNMADPKSDSRFNPQVLIFKHTNLLLVHQRRAGSLYTTTVG